jgi:succinate dehydrogenase flavin-adding protein (antitoxin of CptAB toxin-antitoxin module)
MLENRSLIVVNGLTQEERERYGLDYQEGETLTQEAFYKLLNYSDSDICSIFRKLCEEHRRVVAKLFLSAYFEKRDNRITAEKVKSLNEISKENDKDGMFKPILEDMGDRFAE